MSESIRVEGLKGFVRSLKELDRELPTAMRHANNAVASIVVDDARPKIAVRTGKAQRTLKAKSTRTAVRVSAGSKKAPYYGWLDFGGSTGRKRSVRRPFMEEGRYIYPSYSANRDEVLDAMVTAYTVVARNAGLDVT